MPEYSLRDVTTIADIDQCIELQRETWGMPDVDITPARLFIIARWAGISPIGAFDSAGRLLGFVHTLRAMYDGRAAYYSHMLAVDAALRDSGIGYRLKLAQRQRALAEGVELIVWTFDPLQSRNAHLNINKLGAIVRRYEENFYGEAHASVFDAGIGSDRVFAEWWVASPRVERAVSGGVPAPESAHPVIEVPDDINALKQVDQTVSREWRLRTREAFQRVLAEGHTIVGLRRDAAAGLSRYLAVDKEHAADALG